MGTPPLKRRTGSVYDAAVIEIPIHHVRCAENLLRFSSQAPRAATPFVWQYPPDGAGYPLAVVTGPSNQAPDTIERGSNAMSPLPSRLENGGCPVGGQAQHAPWGWS